MNNYLYTDIFLQFLDYKRKRFFPLPQEYQIGDVEK